MPLGVPVIQDEAARDNMDQNGANDGGRLPFRDGSLDLICNRHESFLALEVSRVLAPGGAFVTQQVDYHDSDDLAQILGIETPEEPDSWSGLAERQVTEAGLVIEEVARADQRIRFDDIAAVVFYLKAVSWSIPGYSLEKYRDRLRALYEDASAWPVVTSGTGSCSSRPSPAEAPRHYRAARLARSTVARPYLPGQLPARPEIQGLRRHRPRRHS